MIVSVTFYIMNINEAAFFLAIQNSESELPIYPSNLLRTLDAKFGHREIKKSKIQFDLNEERIRDRHVFWNPHQYHYFETTPLH